MNDSARLENATNSSDSQLLFQHFPPCLLDIGYSLLIVFAIVGTLTNFLSALAILICRKLQNNPTSKLVVNLCLADGLHCALTIPFKAVIFRDRGWHYGDPLCEFTAVVNFANVGASVFTVVAIAINRYILIAHPAKYRKIYTRTGVGISIASTWLLTFLLILLPLSRIWGKFGYDPKLGTCSILPHHGKSSKPLLYVGAYLFPATFFLVCYARIYYVVCKTQRAVRKLDDINFWHFFKNGLMFWKRKSNKEGQDCELAQRLQRRLQVLKISMAILITFTVCTLPGILLRVFFRARDVPVAFVVCYMLFYMSASVNPFIYVVMSTEYRVAYVMLLNRITNATGIGSKVSSTKSIGSSSQIAR